jgi:hypothetical protein
MRNTEVRAKQQDIMGVVNLDSPRPHQLPEIDAVDNAKTVPASLRLLRYAGTQFLNSAISSMPHIFVFPRGLVRAHSASRVGRKFAVDYRMDSAPESKSEPLAARVLVPAGNRLSWRAPDWHRSDFDLPFCDDVFDGCGLHVMFADLPQERP